MAASSGDGFHVAFFFGAGDHAVHEGFYGGVLREVVFDNLGGLFARDAQALRETEGGDAVDDAEVDHFGFAAHVGGDVGECHAEDFGGGGGVDIFAIDEGLFHSFVAAEVRHNAQLNLRVVGGQQGELFAAGHKGAADFLPLFGADGNVLNVGVG